MLIENRIVIRRSLKNAEEKLTEGTTFTFENFFPLRSCEWCQFVQTPIHFLGPLWCQKTNRLCIWSLVINSWIRSIPRTEMNQPEQRIKRRFLSSLSHATGSAFFFFFFLQLVCFFSTFQLIYFWLENTHLPLLRWHVFEQLMRPESTTLEKEKVCLISVTEDLGDVFISL